MMSSDDDGEVNNNQTKIYIQTNKQPKKKLQIKIIIDTIVKTMTNVE